MANEFNRATFSAKEWKLDFTLNGTKVSDLGVKSFTIPGISDASTEEIKLNNATRKVVVSPGTANDFTFTTVAVTDAMNWRNAAQEMYPYVAELSGAVGTAFAGDKIVISGKVMGFDDLQIGADSVPESVFKGNTDYFSYIPHA